MVHDHRVTDAWADCLTAGVQASELIDVVLRKTKSLAKHRRKIWIRIHGDPAGVGTVVHETEDVVGNRRVHVIFLFDLIQPIGSIVREDVVFVYGDVSITV